MDGREKDLQDLYIQFSIEWSKLPLLRTFAPTTKALNHTHFRLGFRYYSTYGDRWLKAGAPSHSLLNYKYALLTATSRKQRERAQRGALLATLAGGAI